MTDIEIGTNPYCSFCGKHKDEFKKAIRAEGLQVLICDVCVVGAMRQLHADRTFDDVDEISIFLSPGISIRLKLEEFTSVHGLLEAGGLVKVRGPVNILDVLNAVIKAGEDALTEQSHDSRIDAAVMTLEAEVMAIERSGEAELNERLDPLRAELAKLRQQALD